MSEATPRFQGRFQLAADVVSRDVDSGLVLVNLRNGATWKLNQVGAAVCRRLDGSTDVGEVIGDIQRRYEVGAEILRRDVEALLAELQRQGLVEPSA